MAVLTALFVVVLLSLGLSRRLSVVSDYRNFAGDGWQYYHLAQNLVGPAHRYAFGPPPLPLASSRLPGYPLFVALVGFPAPNFNDADVASRVAHSQAFLDVVTAFFAFLLAAELGLRAPRILALALVCASPFLAIATGYILSETLSVLVTTATLFFLLRAVRTRLRLHLALAGATLGLGLLVRADTITLLPAFFVPLLYARASLGDRLRAALVAGAAVALVFAPWPLRNIARFGSPHLLGSSWVTRAGDPLPTGVQAWLRTWAVDPQSAADVAWKMTRATPIFSFAPDASDSPAERKRATALFQRYAAEGLISPAVDEGFFALARERRERDRFRYYLWLPLRRAVWLWVHPVPDWELPIVSHTLGLPEARDRLVPLTHRTLALAALGLLLLACLSRRRAPLARPLAALATVTILSRTLAIAFVVPGGTQRYTFELLPLLFVLAAVALAGPAELLFRRLHPAAEPGLAGNPE